MRKFGGFISALLFSHAIALGQEASLIQNPTVGIHYIFNDFKTPVYLKTSSLSEVIRSKRFGKLKDMESGLALSYTQGISKHFDFTSTLIGSFSDYPTPDGTFNGLDNLLLEGDASIRAKMFSNHYWVTPFIQVGTGVSSYSSSWGAFIPAGIGLQLNFFDEAFLLFNAQYRIAVTENVSNHFFYSIGLAGNIGKKK
jgi:hypothetical protein